MGGGRRGGGANLIGSAVDVCIVLMVHPQALPFRCHWIGHFCQRALFARVCCDGWRAEKTKQTENHSKCDDSARSGNENVESQRHKRDKKERKSVSKVIDAQKRRTVAMAKPSVTLDGGAESARGECKNRTYRWILYTN